MMSLVQEHIRQCMPCSINISMTLQTEILSIVTSDYLKQMHMIILKTFNSMFCIFEVFGYLPCFSAIIFQGRQLL